MSAPIGRRTRSGGAWRQGGAALIALGLSGCLVGPDYVPPKPAMPSKFAEPPPAVGAARSGQSAQNDPAWWKRFDDARLNALEDEALRSGPDLAVAEARVREARALRGIADSALYPTAIAGAEYDRSHGSANVPTGVPPGGLGPGIDSNLYQVGFDASWEIDVFGGRRRASESAKAGYQAAIEDRADVELTLLAEVARNYIELRGEQRRLAVANENLAVQRDALALTQSLLDAGLASRLDVVRAQALVLDTESQLPGFEARAHATIYRIGVLVGRPPEALLADLDGKAPIPITIADVPVGLPSNLLRRRPDIRAAERRITAANARVGVATADLYPHFSLTALAGLQSLDSSTFLNASSRYGSVGPSVSWLIFDANKVRFTISAEQARTDATRADYQKTVLGALRDVETALSAYAEARRRQEKLAEELVNDRQAVDLATRLYRQGLEDFLPVLDAERAQFIADDKLAQAEDDAALALVALYKALGGGWR